MLHGTVVKTYSGFYYVQIDDQVWECRLRGKFRLAKQNVLAGDMVKVTKTGEKTGVIEEILPRRTELERPLVANVSQVVMVLACADPDPKTELLDRMLVQAEAAGLTSVVCFNKTDLVSPDVIELLTEDYYKAGYCVLLTSTLEGTGIDELRQSLKEHITVFAGPSGSGKSSLLNAIHPGFSLKTGKVSEKIGRGRHTTRFAELMELEPGTLVVDSPGFSALYLPEIDKQHLAEMFPEFLPYIDQCKFNGCLHRAEPHCAVKAGVEKGVLSRKRYDNYLVFLDEIVTKERRY